MRRRNLLAILPVLALANEGLLLDTRHATSDLGWTIAENSKWDEVSGHTADGNESRMMQVCQVNQPNQDNWVRSHYIDNYNTNQQLQRVFIEIEFAIRSCEDIKNVAVCKETFNLYYYESDGRHDTPEWNKNEYSKIDTIAADRRFRPGEMNASNKETREIGPLSKKGLFVAIQDAGACLTIMHIRVYYKYCPQTIHNLAEYERTNAGASSSPAAAQGRCVANAIQVSTPKYHCNAYGEWIINSGVCLCRAGYTPNADYSECAACAPNTYKSASGNDPCRQCPSNSVSYATTSRDRCTCMSGYARAVSESPDAPCTTTPSAPLSLTIGAVTSNNVTLDWVEPADLGGRDDTEYGVLCQECAADYCSSCSSSVRYPAITRELTATITGLSGDSRYTFKIIAINGVTGSYQIDSYQPSATVTTTTKDIALSPRITASPLVEKGHQSASSVAFEWQPPYPLERGSVLEYKTYLTNVESKVTVQNTTLDQGIILQHLEPGTRYSFQVQAITQHGAGPKSMAINIVTDAAGALTDQITSEPNTEFPSPDNTAKIAGIAAGVAVIIIMIVVFLAICTRRASYQKGRKYVTELDAGQDVTFQPVHREHPLWEHDIVNQTVKQQLALSSSQNQPQELDQTRLQIGTQCRSNPDEPYDLLKGQMLGVDGYSAVPVLVKRVKSNATGQQVNDFKNDVAILSRIRHENVIAIEGIISARSIIVTEWMEHQALDEFLRLHRSQFNQVQQLRMMADVAGAMKHLVELGYVHRDLAARNIQINSQLRCKLADMSMARKIADTQFPHQIGRCLYKWSAPEAISQRRYSEASDVWSFGVVAWEIQNQGESPYWEMNDEEVIRKIESGYRLPCTSGCPPQLHQMMLDCWKQMPNERTPFNLVVKSLDRFIRTHAATTSMPSHRSSQYSGSCMTLDSNASNTSSLAGWLDGIGLGHYRERLQQRGCMTLENIVALSRRDLQDIGIVSASEQKHLIDQARLLHAAKTQQRSVGYSQRCEMSLERGTIIGV